MTSGCSSPQVDYLSVPKAPAYLKRYPKAAPKCVRETVRDLAKCEKRKDAHIAYLQSKSRRQASYIRKVEKEKSK